MSKIIRSICYFTSNPSEITSQRLQELREGASSNGYSVQTLRVCSPYKTLVSLEVAVNNPELLLNIGTVDWQHAQDLLPEFVSGQKGTFNIDLSNEEIGLAQVDYLFEVIAKQPAKTFDFTFVFNNQYSSPYFPSATYESEGFSIGLQPTDLATGTHSIAEWFAEMKKSWIELVDIFGGEQDFMGIDSSIAPLFTGESSLIYRLKRYGYKFTDSFSTNVYTQITNFIKSKNPRPIGLCGLMMPCLEDFELAKHYEQGEFNIERNIFVSLHSGLGIDTYPIALDQDRQRIVEVLKLVQALSNKYQKPLSARFVSDGKAKIGERSQFNNQYLYDVNIRAI